MVCWLTVSRCHLSKIFCSSQVKTREDFVYSSWRYETVLVLYKVSCILAYVALLDIDSWQIRWQHMHRAIER